MKFSIGKTLQLAATIALSFIICQAQTAIDKPIEPESIGAFYYLDSSTGTLKRLPQEEFKRHTGTGFSSSSTSVRVSGQTSPFHFAANDQATFVFKVFKDEDASRAKLFQFNVKGSEREYDLSTWKHRETTTNQGLSVNLAKYGQSSFKLTPETPLSPGEYALTLGPTVFTFSVSGK